jgi:hypothetical protein
VLERVGQLPAAEREGGLGSMLSFLKCRKYWRKNEDFDSKYCQFIQKMDHVIGF